MTVNVGFLGGGFMTEVHSRGARLAGARIVGVAASSPESSQRASERLGLGRPYASAEELINDESIDLVHICTPNALHAEQAAAALAAGKHVVCEKPLGINRAEADELAAAVGDRVATVPFVYRFHPLVREARARMAAGEAGRLLTVQGSYLQDWMLAADDDNWRADVATGGPSRAFADIGSHLADLVEFITGDRIAAVAATSSVVHAERGGRRVENEDAAALVIRTASGAIGTLLVSQVAPGRKNALVVEIAGSESSIRFDQENPESIWWGRRTGSVLLPRDPDQLSGDAQRLSIIPAGHPQGYQDAFNAFVADSHAAVHGAAPDGLPTFADGARAAAITDAFLAAAQSDGWVDLSP
ncbi:Gfo/Idh/MocA family protein [Propionibacteriaceae bacterium Y1700]|uniref:Gfo/Idh/MocA family protein n=1 Tax=Microlunatus sp. Y1700 TaxID=3418487 RepID=UPI003DA79217